MTDTCQLARFLVMLRSILILAVFAVALLAACLDGLTAPTIQLVAAATIELSQATRFQGLSKVDLLSRARGPPFAAAGGVPQSTSNVGLTAARSTQAVSSALPAPGFARSSGAVGGEHFICLGHHSDRFSPACCRFGNSVAGLGGPADRRESKLHGYGRTEQRGERLHRGSYGSALGKHIDTGGVCTTGSTPGNYRVIATKTEGSLADIAIVIVAASPPPPLPEPAFAQVIIEPAAVALSAKGRARFGTYEKISDGDSVAVTVTFSATGGSITADGLYTAGAAGGSYRIIARHPSGLSDTTSVTITGTTTVELPRLPTASPASGVPFGAFGARAGELNSPMNLLVMSASPSTLMDQLMIAKRGGIKVIVNFAGGSYKNNFGPDGNFSYEVWKSRVDRFLSFDLKPYIEDGTLFGFYLIDEPNDPNSWGGRTVPYETLERMARYSKTRWPGLMAIVRVKPSWLKHAPFRWVYLDAGWAQYSERYGDVRQYRDLEVAAAKAAGLKLMFSLNVLNGGEVYDGCDPGTQEGKCKMTVSELRSFGTVLAAEPFACGLTMWKYDPIYMTRPDVASALRDIGRVAASRTFAACK